MDNLFVLVFFCLIYSDRGVENLIPESNTNLCRRVRFSVSASTFLNRNLTGKLKRKIRANINKDKLPIGAKGKNETNKMKIFANRQKYGQKKIMTVKRPINRQTDGLA